MNDERESFERSERLVHHRLQHSIARFRRLSHSFYIMGIVAMSVFVFSNGVDAGQQENRSDRTYWRTFVENFDKILGNNQNDIRPVRAFLATIDPERSESSSEDIIKSSVFFVRSFNSGRFKQYDFANDGILVSVMFEQKSGHYLPGRAGPRLKKTTDDYKINPLK